MNPTRSILVSLVAMVVVGGATSLAQEARSPFGTATVASDTGSPLRRLADLDLDGDVDAVSWTVALQGTPFRVRSYRNDGEGRLVPGAWQTVSSSPGSPRLLGEIGHLDAGPVPDLCLVHGSRRHTLLGNGDGTWTAAPVTDLAAEPLALALADVDLDGIDDLAWADELVLRVQTSLGFQSSVLHGVSDVGTVRALVRDGPAKSDVFVVHGSDRLQVVFGSPTTGLVAGPAFVHGLAGTMFDTGDVDGDGDVDGVVFGMGASHEYRVLRRLDAGTFQLEPVRGGGPGEFLRDVDGDGDLDGVCCSGGGPTWDRFEHASPFEIALNDGTGEFSESFQLPGMGSPQLAGVADLDADGDLDLVAGTVVYYARGPIRAPDAPPPGSAVPPVRDPRDVADCDGDGDPDVGFSLRSAWVNDGSGHFFALEHGVARVPPGMTLRGPGYPGDFDGDGDLDLLVGTERLLRGRTPSGSLAQRRTVGTALLENDGAGALALARRAADDGVTFEVDALEARASLVADVDSDGDLDLVTRAVDPTPSAPILSRLWINAGLGTFVEAALPQHRRAELLVDLDVDGSPDLVVSKYPLVTGYPELKVLRSSATGAGPPVFVEQSMLSVRLVGNVVAGDLHSRTLPGGGFPDLFFVSTGYGPPASGVVALSGFDPEESTWGFALMNSASLPVTARASVGDIDLDGSDDYMLGAYGLEVDRCTFGLRRGAGWWEHAVTSQLLPDGLLVDVDGDGDLDVLGERIVINTTLP